MEYRDSMDRWILLFWGWYSLILVSVTIWIGINLFSGVRDEGKITNKEKIEIQHCVGVDISTDSFKRFDVFLDTEIHKERWIKRDNHTQL